MRSPAKAQQDPAVGPARKPAGADAGSPREPKTEVGGDAAELTGLVSAYPCIRCPDCNDSLQGCEAPSRMSKTKAWTGMSSQVGWTGLRKNPPEYCVTILVCELWVMSADTGGHMTQ